MKHGGNLGGFDPYELPEWFKKKLDQSEQESLSSSSGAAKSGEETLVSPTSGFRTSNSDDFQRLFDINQVPIFAAGDKTKCDFKETIDLLSRLAQHMSDHDSSPDENKNIPAGYTYFGQFLAHDISQSVQQPLADDRDSPTSLNNNRRQPLALESLYGGGPLVSPHLYVDQGSSGNRLLRIGKVKGRDGNPSNANDVPRAEMSEFYPYFGNAEPAGQCPMIADSRNQSTVILSQLVVLFSKIHNRICKIVEENVGDYADIKPGQRAGDVIFEVSKNIFQDIYHSIVRNDFLERLLDTDIYEELQRGSLQTSPFFKEVNDMIDQGKFPIEFNLCFYRIGHSMVRQVYNFGKDKDGEQKTELLKNLFHFGSGAKRNSRITEDYVVDWDDFFAMGTVSPNFSRSIGPLISSWISDNSAISNDINGSGLTFRDLTRAHRARMSSAQSVVQYLKSQFTGINFANSIDLSLEGGDKLSPSDIARLSTDTPLLYFLLCEAKSEQSGAKLGKIGSLLVGSVFFAALGNIRASPFSDEFSEKYLNNPMEKIEMSNLVKFVSN